MLLVKMKLKLILKLLENCDLCHFTFCDLLHKDSPVSVALPKNHAAELTNFFDMNVKVRSNYICSHATNVHIHIHIHVGMQFHN
jgi:hypothetical protein